MRVIFPTRKNKSKTINKSPICDLVAVLTKYTAQIQNYVNSMDTISEVFRDSGFFDNSMDLNESKARLDHLRHVVVAKTLDCLPSTASREWMIKTSPPKRPGYMSFVVLREPFLVVRFNYWEEEYVRFLEDIPTVHTHNWHMVSVPMVGRLRNLRFTPHDTAEGEYSRFTELGGFGTGNREFISKARCELTHEELVEPGTSYLVEKGDYHAVIPDKPLTVTICVQFAKEPQDRFLCLKDSLEVSNYLSQLPLTEYDLDSLEQTLHAVYCGH